MTLTQALRAIQTFGVDRLDAQLLLLHTLGRPTHDRAWLLAHDSDALPDALETTLMALAQRRAAGEPLAYIVGRKEFFGLDLQVDTHTLVPRPDTETLVEWSLEVIGSTPANVLDLGTGSGAIALAIRHAAPQTQVTAVDASAGALAMARANAQRLALPIGFHHGSWFAALPASITSRFDLIVSNPPYIAEHDPHLPALAFEPRSALTAGVDGLDDIRSIVQQAPQHLQPGGWLLLEHGYDQAPAVCALLAAAGFNAVQSRQDLGGHARCSGGQFPTAP
ncbi:peptide chain release factor N(5)-glutamine methyltransferase [Variovorax sp. HJSM1_2]|uniref:peptide chain release factor N(5)-glutamine methyltransferase n=1 Tax=Variovorax sp. HJSM1_2 TaxID=3366263 RepID=UPI003BC668BF